MIAEAILKLFSFGLPEGQPIDRDRFSLEAVHGSLTFHLNTQPLGQCSSHSISAPSTPLMLPYPTNVPSTPSVLPHSISVPSTPPVFPPPHWCYPHINAPSTPSVLPPLHRCFPTPSVLPPPHQWVLPKEASSRRECLGGTLGGLVSCIQPAFCFSSNSCHSYCEWVQPQLEMRKDFCVQKTNSFSISNIPCL